jgi:AmiR/NasT family two-component response regulator
VERGDLERLQQRSAELRERFRAATGSHALVIQQSRAVLDELETAPWRQSRRRVPELVREVEGLKQAMRSRAVIEQAKGVIIGATRCTPDEAFDLLRQQSQHQNRKLHDIAAEIVDDVTRG